MSFEQMIEMEDRNTALALDILSGRTDPYAHLDVDDNYSGRFYNTYAMSPTRHRDFAYEDSFSELCYA